MADPASRAGLKVRLPPPVVDSRTFQTVSEGDRCTFEVLLSKADPNDPALAVIAEIVHDIDLKDAKFSREETSGIAHLMAGLCATSKDDMQRVERGSAVLDELYEYFRMRRS